MESPVRGRTVLVTGGAGFVGSHLVDALVGDNDVRVLDDFSSGRRGHVDPGATVIEGDLREPEALRAATDGVELIFHEAAIVDVTESVDRPVETTDVNLTGGLAVLDAARRVDATVVLASSAAVYGRPEGLPIPETAPAEPRSPYGLQKRTLEEYARLYAELYDLSTVSLRYFNVYGPRQRGPYSGVVATFLEQARSGGPLTVEGDGEQSRDFVHVRDVVRANLLAAAAGEPGAAYNVGTGERTSIRELAAAVREAVDPEIGIVHREPRTGDVEHSLADVTRARERLGFEASYDLEAGLRTLLTDADRGG